MSFQTPITISEAINNIDTKHFLLPSIQREFVWKHNKIEWLFDSIMRDYPIGSFLFWKVEGETKKKFKFYSFINEYREHFKTHNDEFDTRGINEFISILDGQQRLTSLYLGLKGSYAYKKPRVQWKDREYNIPTRYLYLNIEHPLGEDQEDGRVYEFKFIIKDSEIDKKWFRVGDILDIDTPTKLTTYLVENDLYKNQFASDALSTLRDKIHKDQLINYFLEKEQDIDKALNIFIRINSGGEPLNFSDLLMSIAVANWEKKDARKEIHKLVDEVRDTGFFISKDFILKTYLYLYNKDIKFKVKNFGSENAKEFESNWVKIRDCIITTFELVKHFGYVDSTLTSKNALIPIIYYLYHSDIKHNILTKVDFETDRKAMRKWLNLVLVKRIFGGQADNVLSSIRSVFTSDISKCYINDFNSFPSSMIAERLKSTSKNLTLDDDAIENILTTQKDDRYAFSILALLYPNMDYKNGNFHKDHIFPISHFNEEILKKYNIPNEMYEFYYDQNINNSILNLQVLDANENMSKQDKELKDWVISESKKQGVSTDKFCEDRLIPNILEFNEFEEFINKRKEIIISILKTIIN